MILPLLATSGLTLLLYMSGFFVIFTPLPLIFTSLRKGLALAVAAFFLSLFGLAAFYRVPMIPSSFLPMAALQPGMAPDQIAGLGLIYFFYYTSIGFGIVFTAQKSLSLEKSIGTILLAALVIPGVLLAIFSIRSNLHLVGRLQAGIQGLLENRIPLQGSSGQSGVNPEEGVFLKQYAGPIAFYMTRMMPALIINLTLTIISLNIYLLKRWMPSWKPFPGWADFSLWKISERTIWLPIAVGTVFFLNLYLFQKPWLDLVLTNALIVTACLYFFQGISILSFMVRRKIPPFFRIFTYLLILFFMQIVGGVLVILGLFDFWFDFRKLRKVN